MLSAGPIPHNSIHLLIITADLSHFTDFTGYVLFIITSFHASVESTDQCLLNSKVLSCFSGVIMSIRSFFLFWEMFSALNIIVHQTVGSLKFVQNFISIRPLT